MGIVLGINKATARDLAVKTEWYDHKGNDNNKMLIQKFQERNGWLGEQMEELELG